MTYAVLLNSTPSPRPVRMAHALAFLWVLSLADLWLTLWAHHFTPFQEANPLARTMLQHSQFNSLIAFKLSATFTASAIFWMARKTPRAEFALWGMVGVYVLLALQWSTYTTATATLAMR